MSAAPTLDELTIADEAVAWDRLGFAVSDGGFTVGATRVRLAGRASGRGIVGWSLRDLRSTALDGLPTARSEAPAPPAARHPNGAVAIDHVVVSTPDFDRTRGALEAAGIALRRERTLRRGERPLRMGFFRIGEAILELVEHPEAPDRSAPRASGGSSSWSRTSTPRRRRSATGSASPATRSSPGGGSRPCARPARSARRLR